MVNKYIFTLGILLSSILWAHGQTVSTFLEQSGSTFEAITWAPDGKIYVVDFVSGDVYRMDIGGNITNIGTLSGALGGAVDHDGNFYCSEFNTGRIHKFDSDDNASIYASGLVGPAGILIDDANQIMYVANYSGNSIATIDMTAANPSPEILASGGLINGPDGLVFSSTGDLISANFNNNSVQRITPEGVVSQFAVLNGSSNSGYLVRRGNQYIITGAYGPNLYQIDEDGNVSNFAGTGSPGSTDGNIDAAQFEFPNGIAISPSGDSLLVTHSTDAGLIRLITNLDGISDTRDLISASSLHLYPNPAQDRFSVSFENLEQQLISIQLLDTNGRVLDTLTKRQLLPGLFQEEFTINRQLPDGTYILRIEVEGLYWSHPLLIQR